MKEKIETTPRRKTRLFFGLFAFFAFLLCAPGSSPSPALALSPSNSKPHAAGMRSSASASAGRVQASNEPIIGVAELNVERRGHTATQLADGKILIIGGENKNGLVNESEIFNPHSRKFSVAARTIVSRTDHTATVLADGRVLVVGGRNHKGPLNSTEIFDPKTKLFFQGAFLNRARAGHSATVLADGRILIVGGDSEGSAEIFDPTLQSFILVEARLSAPRAFHSAVLLQNGKILIAGGLGPDGSAIKSAEIFDTAKMSFSATRNTMRGARSRPMLHLLPDGKVQVIGGDQERSMEMFNPGGEYFTAYAHLLPSSDLLAGISEILHAQTRAALIHKTDPQDTKLQAELSETFNEVLDRSDYSLNEISQLNQALVAGGVSSSGKFLKSVVVLSSSSATVTTDKTDYLPGETVTITGTGWQPGETVSMVLHQEPGTQADRTLSSVADSDGNFTNTDFSPGSDAVGATFTLTATGQSSNFTAQTTFTDAIGQGSLNAPKGTFPQTGGCLNRNKWKVQAGDTITDTITGATDARVVNGTVTVQIQSSNFGNTQLIGTYLNGTITFTWQVPPTGVCLTTIVSYMATNPGGNPTFKETNNNALQSCVNPGDGTAAAGYAIVDANGNVIQSCAAACTTTVTVSPPTPMICQGQAPSGGLSFSATVSGSTTAMIN